MLKLTRTICYEFAWGSIMFRPCEQMPGFSHKVIGIRYGVQVAVDWLANGEKVTAKRARAFLAKHAGMMHA